MSAVVTTNPEVMHGTPCFAGTRVPAQALFDYLEGSYSIDEFLVDFPSVSKAQVLQLLDELRISADKSAEAIAV